MAVPISRHHLTPLWSSWWRRWAKESAIILLLLLLLLLFTLSATLHPRSQLATDFKHRGSPPSSLVPLTLVRNAQARGAVCLDGSSPGYHFQKGTGSGSNNWVLHIEGGGWCDSEVSCSSRKLTPLGSSKFMEKEVLFSGILSSKQVHNPDFFNWNKVKIRYCDGASFSGLVEDKDKDKSNTFFKGQLIWEAVMGELLDLGLSSAKQALLSGCSAGGLATLLHCDNFRDQLPKTAFVKCLADAAFFLDEKDVSGKRTMRSFYQRVVSLQGVTTNFSPNCTSKFDSYKCFFPREIVGNTKTPVFIVQPAYDFWQIQNILVPYSSDADDFWQACKRNIQECSSNELDRLQEYRSALLSHLSDFQESKDGGMFINSCFIHCQTWISSTWHSAKSPRVNNHTIAEAVGDWFFGRREVKEVDCPYPCNPTCLNMAF